MYHPKTSRVLQSIPGGPAVAWSRQAAAFRAVAPRPLSAATPGWVAAACNLLGPTSRPTDGATGSAPAHGQDSTVGAIIEVLSPHQVHRCGLRRAGSAARPAAQRIPVGPGGASAA